MSTFEASAEHVQDNGLCGADTISEVFHVVTFNSAKIEKNVMQSFFFIRINRNFA
jgi:hypothetical protein